MKQRLSGLLLGLVCLGCGAEDWQSDTYPARGRITINGEPPAGALIELRPLGKPPDARNSRPWAVVEDDGSYVLSTYEASDGAPAGDYAVTIRWPPDVSKPSMADRLSGAYSNPQRSQWNVTVAEGENELPPIEITGATVLSKEQLESPQQRTPGPMKMAPRNR